MAYITISNRVKSKASGRKTYKYSVTLVELADNGDVVEETALAQFRYPGDAHAYADMIRTRGMPGNAILVLVVANA